MKSPIITAQLDHSLRLFANKYAFGECAFEGYAFGEFYSDKVFDHFSNNQLLIAEACLITEKGRLIGTLSC